MPEADATNPNAGATGAAVETPQAPEAATTNPNAEGSGKSPEVVEAKTFTQEQVNAIVSERLAKEKAKQDKATEAATEKAKADALREQGEYKPLYEQTLAKLQEVQAAHKELELASLRRDAGAKFRLPPALAERLRGETVEELEADAKLVAASLPKPGAPNTNDIPGSGNGKAAMTEAELQAMSSAIGIPIQYLK